MKNYAKVWFVLFTHILAIKLIPFNEKIDKKEMLMPDVICFIQSIFGDRNKNF